MSDTDVIREAISLCCASQDEVTANMGLTRNAIQNWRRGKGPSARNRVLFVKVLRTRADRMLDLADMLDGEV